MQIPFVYILGYMVKNAKDEEPYWPTLDKYDSKDRKSANLTNYKTKNLNLFNMNGLQQQQK